MGSKKEWAGACDDPRAIKTGEDRRQPGRAYVWRPAFPAQGANPNGVHAKKQKNLRVRGAAPSSALIGARARAVRILTWGDGGSDACPRRGAPRPGQAFSGAPARRRYDVLKRRPRHPP